MEKKSSTAIQVISDYKVTTLPGTNHTIYFLLEIKYKYETKENSVFVYSNSHIYCVESLNEFEGCLDGSVS